jgi:hypothetical protein
MKNENNAPGLTHNVEIILIVPFGVEEDIFPWGIHSVRDYLGSTCESVKTHILDFRSGSFFEELNSRYSDLLSRLFFSLKGDYKNTFFGQTTRPYIFAGFTAFAGEDFFKLTGQNGLFKRSLIKGLRAFSEEVKNYIFDKFSPFMKKSANVKRIWGLSVYDRTLFNCLYIAGLIKQTDPGASIILGGDYFNFEAAEKTKKAISFVDGITVGYGEEIIRQIVLKKQAGGDVHDLQINGFINEKHFSPRAEGKPPGPGAVCVPPNYEQLSTNPIISYVQQNEKGLIRVLSQRGCSWGKCIFCTQIDKEMFFSVSVESLIEDIKNIIASKKSVSVEEPVKISFDSDENSIDMFIQFINYLNDLEDSNLRFEIILWLQVKMFRKKLAEALTKIDSNKIHVTFKLNFESLNVDTLRLMRKGHSPLQGIEAAKAVQDCGHSFITNYFIHFPLENSSGVAEEAGFLKRIAHLAMPPNGKIILFPYESNNRDAIYFDQDKYKIKITQRKGDDWLKKIFNIDLPFSMWTYIYDDKPSFNLENLLRYSYHKTIKKRDLLNVPRLIANINWNSKRFPIAERAAAFFRYLNLYTWESVYGFLQFSRKGKAFRLRSQLFKYFSKLSDAFASSSYVGNGSGQQVRQSQFYLKGNELVKKFYTPGGRDKRSTTLEKNELKVLRYLYWTQKRDAVIKHFKDEMKEPEITRIIDRHIDLGSVVQFKGLLLCVVNDPGFWEK